ncbi:MAG: hypothetical protein EBX37_09520 [Alphaproteobacteria bacterium]|nr:hypothetical protein [Alphaproteobacteria bacterium]
MTDRHDAIIDRLLPLIPRLGWTGAALAEAAGDAALAESAFPRGVRDAIAAWSALADRRMAEAAAAEGLEGLKVPARIRRVIAIRLEQAQPHKAALRDALALLALPWHAPLSARLAGATVSFPAGGAECYGAILALDCSDLKRLNFVGASRGTILAVENLSETPTDLEIRRPCRPSAR